MLFQLYLSQHLRLPHHHPPTTQPSSPSSSKLDHSHTSPSSSPTWQVSCHPNGHSNLWVPMTQSHRCGPLQRFAISNPYPNSASTPSPQTTPSRIAKPSRRCSPICIYTPPFSLPLNISSSSNQTPSSAPTHQRP